MSIAYERRNANTPDDIKTYGKLRVFFLVIQKKKKKIGVDEKMKKRERKKGYVYS